VIVNGSVSNQRLLNRQTGSYTLALTDNSKVIEMNSGSVNTLTVPLNSTISFPSGAFIDVVQYGTGQTTITGSSGVTIRSLNGWLKISGQYGTATLTKIGGDEWYLSGNLTS
jgi:hypothetical protein